MESAVSVRDVLTKEYVGVSESDTVLGTVRLMREERAGCALVVRGGTPVGIVTEWDVLGMVAEEASPADTEVRAVMSTPVLTISPDHSLAEAASTMAAERIRHLVVVNGDELVGVLTQRDVITAAGSFSAATATDRSVDSFDAETAPEAADGTLANGADEYTTQGVCEACGSLADSLWEVNGKLVCSDCRSV